MGMKCGNGQTRAAFMVARVCPRGPRQPIVGLVALLCLLAPVSTALAAAPNHVGLIDPLHGFALNHACGTAVDTEGDIYVSSAGDSKIEVFDSEGSHLASISDLNEPCGLAVDSRGDVFVSEKAVGNVVRYVPDAYPFSGSPSYGAAELIDASGTARGIGIDTSTRTTNADIPIGGDDTLYIARGDHIDAYANESQRIQVNATGGTFKLRFDGQETAALPYNATHAEVQAALEGLSTIGPHNVSVTTANFQATDHLIVFTHELGLAAQPPIEVDGSGLTGGGATHSETNGGLVATIGSGALTDATGVAAYSYQVNAETVDRYVFVADAATNQVKIFAGPSLASLKARKLIDGPKEGEGFGFGSAGAYLAVDPGNASPESHKCASVAEQACTAGHLLVYDEVHEAVDEFDASGEFLDQFSDPALGDAEPTGLAIDRSGDASDGTVYVSSGSGAGAELLAFGPLAAPARALLPELSHPLISSRLVAVDSKGDVYAAAGSAFHVYGPNGKEIEKIGTPEPPDDLAVDSSGRVYVLFIGNNLSNPNEYKVEYYTPGAYPPSNGTPYSGPTVVATGNSLEPPGRLTAIGLNPENNHLFVGGVARMIELGSAAEGSPILNPCFACGLLGSTVEGVAVYGKDGNVYVSEGGFRVLHVVDPSGEEILTHMTGAGSPEGPFSVGAEKLAIDQSNGHVLFVSGLTRGVVEEYDASGAFVAQFGEFTKLSVPSGIAIDNSGGANDGDVYVAYDDTKPGTPDIWAFSQLQYGGPPRASTGVADGVGDGNATLRGNVNPEGSELTGCSFEYILDSQYRQNLEAEKLGFEGATVEACAESLASLGKGTKPVSVHLDLSGLDPEARYRFRLLAENKFGACEGCREEAGLFGPPLATTTAALPVLYDEAVLRAKIDPSGLPTTYRFEYGTSEAYGRSTPGVELPPGDGAVAVKAALIGLQEGAKYHFRVVAENEAGVVPGLDRSFLTQARRPSESCPNAEYRTGLSTRLPDCRVYELATPAETRGAELVAATPGSSGEEFNNWLAAPHGGGAGETLSYFVFGTLPSFEGNGRLDGYHAQRAAGEHPTAGWTSTLFSPSYEEAGGELPSQHGIAADQLYSFWDVGTVETRSNDLRTPSGFEAVGRGGLGTDAKADGRYISAGANHVIFTSRAGLEVGAAPAGTEAIYDRPAGASSAEVVSVKADGSTFGAGKDAVYLGASEDGSAVAFAVDGALYLHRSGNTFEVTPSYGAFASLSEDGRRLFYVKAGDLYVFDAETQASSEIAEESIFIGISSDGSRVAFSSEDALTGGEENEAGEAAAAGKPNLYLWDGSGIRFVAVLDPGDFVEFANDQNINLSGWTSRVSAGASIGRDAVPVRATPDGEVFVFQSHARLTAYDNTGPCGPQGKTAPCGEIYRYDPAAPLGQQLLCVSCDPSGAPSGGDAMLQSFLDGPTRLSTLISNITESGNEVFFQSPDRLLPEDANDAIDIYEWKAEGAGEPECARPGGCLALISSGQGEAGSFLYGMSADGRDVFFETREKLVGLDVSGSPSIYDAREGGGIPEPPAEPPCQGDACQPLGSGTPTLPTAATTGSGFEEPESRAPCPKGRHRVKGRCVKAHKHRHHRRVKHKRKTGK